MKLAQGKFSCSAALVASSVYAVCSIFVVMFPKGSEVLMSALTHVQSPRVIRNVSVGGFVLGIVQVYIYTFIGAWVLAVLLNRNSK
jgi:hypothetical protein